MASSLLVGSRDEAALLLLYVCMNKYCRKWDAHFMKMNAAWKIWQLLMRRLSTVQEPCQTYDSVRRWWTRKKNSINTSYSKFLSLKAMNARLLYALLYGYPRNVVLLLSLSLLYVDLGVSPTLFKGHDLCNNYIIGDSVHSETYTNSPIDPWLTFQKTVI